MSTPKFVLGSSLADTQPNVQFLLNKKFSEARIKSFKRKPSGPVQVCCNKCLKAISHSINIVKAVIMRLVFSIHSFIAICIVFTINQELWCLVNILGVVFLLIELFVTIIKRKGKEPKWFFPCFFIYIATMIPPIWFIELHRIEIKRNNTAVVQNSLDFSVLKDSFDGLGIQSPDDIITNATASIQLTHDAAAVSLEISLMLLVILGRWFLPKGSISRSTLSQLLLVYMSLASDIVDLLSLLNETQIQESNLMIYFTLAIFSWSLFQFSLNLVVTRGRSFQGVQIEDEPDEDENDSLEDKDKKSVFSGDSGALKKTSLCSRLIKHFRIDLLDSEVWSILVTLMFQDGPFLALRLTAVVRFNVRTFVTMFFTCKNAIILFLQMYRLSAICSENDKDDDDALETIDFGTSSLKLNELGLKSGLENILKNSALMTLSPKLLRASIAAAAILPKPTGGDECCCPCHQKNLTNKLNSKTA